MKIAVLAGLVPVRALGAAGAIPAAQAQDHAGQMAAVCGKVVSARYPESSNKQPTFLNFDKPFPGHTFTGIVVGESRAKFGRPEMELTDPQRIQLDSR